MTDKKAMRQDFGAENWPELAPMIADDLAGWLLDLVRCYAWSGAMPGPVLGRKAARRASRYENPPSHADFRINRRYRCPFRFQLVWLLIQVNRLTY